MTTNNQKPTVTRRSLGKSLGPVALLVVAVFLALPAAASAEQPMREWTTTAGEHTVTASFVRQTDRYVTLKKQDGRVKILPKTMLSKSDQQHLESVSTKPSAERPSPTQPSQAKVPGDPNANPSANAKLPSASPQPNLAGLRPAADALAAIKKQQVTMGGPWKYKPIPTTWKIKDPKISGTPHDQVRAFRLNAERTHVGTVMPNPFTHQNAVVVTNLANGTEAPPIPIGKGFNLTDVDASGTRIVVVKRDASTKSELRVLDAKGKPLFIWDTIPEGIERAPNAWFIDEDFLLVDHSRQLLLWNWRTKRVIYLIEGGIISQLSMKRDTIAFYRDMNAKRHMFFFDTRTGEPVGDFVLPSDIFQSAFAFSPSGSRFATRAAEGQRVDVWELTAQPETEKRISIHPPARSRTVHSFSWIGEQFLISHSTLLDTRMGIPVWQYQGAIGATGIYGNRFLSNARGRLARLTFPAREDVQKIQSLAKTDVVLFGKGAKVRLQTEFALMDQEERDTTLKNVTQMLANQGVSVADDGEFTLTLTIKKLPPEKAQIYLRDKGEELISFVPHEHAIRLVCGKRALFSKDYTARPRSAQPQEGETLQQAVDRRTGPRGSIFSSVRLPYGLRVLAGDETLLGKTKVVPEIATGTNP